MMFPKLALPSKITSMAWPDLAARLRPQTVNAPEANPYVLYDTQNYVAAGQATLNFFRNVNADSTLSNMEIAGSLPANTYFDIWRIFVSSQRLGTSTADATGALNDIQRILNTARGTLTFTVNSKPLGPIPLRFFGDAGQAAGFSAAAGTAGAVAHVSFGGMPANGGFPVNSAIKLGPSQKFEVRLDFVAGVTVATETPLQVALLGILYRQLG